MKISDNGELLIKVANINRKAFYVTKGMQDMQFEISQEQEDRLEELIEDVSNKLERFRKNLQLLCEGEFKRLDELDKLDSNE